MSKQLTLIAFLRAKAGFENVPGHRLSALIEATHREAGCIHYPEARHGTALHARGRRRCQQRMIKL